MSATGRRLAAMLGVLSWVSLVTGAARASTVSIPVHVYLTVADSCKVEIPQQVPIHPDGKIGLALERVLSECASRGVPATLTVTTDADHEGLYVATINF